MPLNIIIADYENPQHASEIVRLMEIYAGDIMGGGKGLSDFAKTNLVQELSQRPFAFTVLAFEGEQAIGLATCFEAFSTFACKPLINIHDVVVLPESRGKGVSQLLLSAIEEEASRRGCCKLTLEILEGNTSAQRAYRKYGFADYQLDPSMGRTMFWDKKI